MPVTQLVTPTEEHEGLQLKKTVFLGYCDVAAGGLYVVFCLYLKFEPAYGKTNNLHRRKQRRRPASQ